MSYNCIYAPNCTLTFSAPREALNHALAEHVRYKADPAYDFTCRIPNCACGGATFEKRDGIVTHLTLKANIYDVACDRNCGRMFKRTSEMRTHLKKCQGGTGGPITSGRGGGGASRASDVGMGSNMSSSSSAAAKERRSLGANVGSSAGRQSLGTASSSGSAAGRQSLGGASGGSSSHSSSSAGRHTVLAPPARRSASPPRTLSPQENGYPQSMQSTIPATAAAAGKTTLVVNGAGSTTASPMQSPATSAAVPVAPAIPGSPAQQPPKKVRAWIGKLGKWVDVDVITDSSNNT